MHQNKAGPAGNAEQNEFGQIAAGLQAVQGGGSAENKCDFYKFTGLNADRP